MFRINARVLFRINETSWNNVDGQRRRNYNLSDLDNNLRNTCFQCSKYTAKKAVIKKITLYTELAYRISSLFS